MCNIFDDVTYIRKSIFDDVTYMRKSRTILRGGKFPVLIKWSLLLPCRDADSDYDGNMNSVVHSNFHEIIVGNDFYLEFIFISRKLLPQTSATQWYLMSCSSRDCNSMINKKGRGRHGYCHLTLKLA